MCVWSQSSQACILPISGVNPWSLPGVVVDEKHSAIVIPGFLPARGQRQLRALSPLTGADPRHSVGMVRGLEPSALLFIPPKKSLFTALQQTRPRRTCRRKDLGRKYETFHRGCPSKTLRRRNIHDSSSCPRQKKHYGSALTVLGPPCSPPPPYFIPPCPYSGRANLHKRSDVRLSKLICPIGKCQGSTLSLATVVPLKTSFIMCFFLNVLARNVFNQRWTQARRGK